MCGNNELGKRCPLEWKWEEGKKTVQRTYQGLDENYRGNVHFAISHQILAAGDQHQIKFWDLDKTSLLDKYDADGEIPVSIFVSCL